MLNKMKYYCCLLLALYCIQEVPAQSINNQTIQVSQDLTIHEIEKNIFVITHHFPWAGNSLVVLISPCELLLVDTPWEATGTKALLQWLRERFSNIHITAVNTHFHQDNLGGNNVLLSQKIPVYGSDLTVRLLKENKSTLIRRTLENLSDPENKRFYDSYKNLDLKPPDYVFDIKKGISLKIGEENIELFYPGPAHTQDNIVVYFSGRKILFGGCMIRSLASTNIGTQSYGDLKSWPQSARNLLKKYPEARIVIPGHGKWGDISLIQHTIDLVNQK